MVDRIHLPPTSENLWGPVAARLGAPRAIIDLVERRGLCSAEEIEQFLFGGPEVLESRILPPTGDLGLAGIETTLEILVEARERREPVIVHGDYDVDGMTGTALLFLALRRAGLVTGWTLPRRSTEGYGLTDASLARCLSGEGIEGLPVGNDRPPRWVISVDTGITAGPAVERAAALGLGVIVTDHHLPSGEYPEAAAAVINPRRPDCPYPNKHLSGVGVAWKLSVALLERLQLVPEADPKRLLQLVALGTLADMVSVTGENRALIRLGLRELFERPIPGTRALCQIAGIKGTRPPRATDILFRMTPRINAAGRMRCGEVAIRVMVSDSGERAAVAAKDLDDINTQRQKIDQRITTVAMKMAEEAIARAEGAVPAAFVLQDAGWHEGVSGIIAARILDQWHRPAVILAPDPGRPGEYRGSARCDMGFDIHAALSGCSDLLERWGGHAQAAGLSIREERVPEFARRFVESAELVRAKGPAGEPAIRTDAEVSLAEIDVNFMEWLERLEPFGPGNEPPVFWAQNVSVQSVGRVGGGKHLRLRVRQGETSFDAIGFGLGALADRLSDPAALRQAAFSPEWNDFRGARAIQLNLKGLL